VSFAAITLCVALQRVVFIYFVIDSVRKLLDTLSFRGSSLKPQCPFTALQFNLGTSHQNKTSEGKEGNKYRENVRRKEGK
jgi:hypothetical protein